MPHMTVAQLNGLPVVAVPALPRHARAGLAPGTARTLLLLALAAAGWAGLAATPPAAALAAIAQAGPQLTRLLRAMAGLKLLFAAAAVAALWWRLALPVSPPRLAAYAAACAAMATGPCLIWGMAHVAAGAVLLHAGLAACVLLLWRDPATAARLSMQLSWAGKAQRIRP